MRVTSEAWDAAASLRQKTGCFRRVSCSARWAPAITNAVAKVVSSLRRRWGSLKSLSRIASPKSTKRPSAEEPSAQRSNAPERARGAETHRCFEVADSLGSLGAVSQCQPEASVAQREVRIQVERRAQFLDGILVLAPEHVREPKREACPRIVAVDHHCSARPFGGRCQYGGEPARAPAMGVPQAEPCREPKGAAIGWVDPQRRR